MIIFSFR